MRVLLVLLLAATLLSGCTIPEEEDPDPLFGVCPQWQQGPQTTTVSVRLDDGTGRIEGTWVPQNESDDVLVLDGHELDLYRIRLHNVSIDGRVELRAFAGDRQVGLRDFRGETPQLVPVVVLSDAAGLEGQEFDAMLSPVAHGSDPAPSPLRIVWALEQGTARLDATVSAHYRVCGAPL